MTRDNVRRTILSALLVACACSALRAAELPTREITGNNIYGFAVNSVSGVLTPLAGNPVSDATLSGGTSPVALTVDPSGKYLYVAHATSTGISIYQIAPGTGALSYISSYSVGVTQTSITSTGVAQ